MTNPKPHLKDLAEIERDCIPGLVEVLRIEAVRYALCFSATREEKPEVELSLV